MAGQHRQYYPFLPGRGTKETRSQRDTDSKAVTQREKKGEENTNTEDTTVTQIEVQTLNTLVLLYTVDI